MTLHFRSPLAPCTVFALALLAASHGHAETAYDAAGYYGSVKLQSATQSAHGMELTSPRVTQRIAGPEHDRHAAGSIALGYQFGNGWRAEGEYTLKRDTRFVSYWAPFDANANEFQVASQRLMVNGYKDFPLGRNVSVYASVGLGVAKVSAQGWQGNTSRQFARQSQNNLSYALGAGVSYAVTPTVSIDLGYRYVDMGKVESGFNTFVNRVSARDEQLKARLTSNEVFVGLRSRF